MVVCVYRSSSLRNEGSQKLRCRGGAGSAKRTRINVRFVDHDHSGRIVNYRVKLALDYLKKSFNPSLVADIFRTAICDLQHQPLARFLSVFDTKQMLPIPTHRTSQRYTRMFWCQSVMPSFVHIRARFVVRIDQS